MPSSNKNIKSADFAPPGPTDLDKLAGLTLPLLRDRYRADLFDDFLPFMDKFVIDHELGGFMCHADRDGSRIDTKKNAWYIGRGIWVYSFLYNELDRQEKHLDVARRAVDFISRSLPAGDELWPAEFTKEGQPLPPRGQYIGGRYVPAGREVYGDLFIAEGLAEFARAADQEKYWYLARDIILKCMSIYDQLDYAPCAAWVYMPGRENLPELPGARLVGVWMLTLRLCTQMLRQKPDESLEGIARRCVDAVLNHHYNPQYDLINEVLNHDFSCPENIYRHLAYTGHAIELLWMLMDEAYRLKDKSLFDRAVCLFQRHLEIAWDYIYGGFFRGLLNVEENTWILDKALWTQEEALIGLLFIIEHTGLPWAKDWFSRVFTYVQNTFSLRRYGFALWNAWTDRKGTFERHYPRIENYHHPRHLMLNLLALERLIQRRGKVSDLFL